MWIQISSGKGPTECELVVGLFLSRFLQECIAKKISLTVLATLPGFCNGSYKSVLLSISDAVSADIIKSINGTIQWTCPSPLRPNHKRKNWFINVEVFNEPEFFEFDIKDVKYEAMKSSGPGGQNVNKVETAIRAIHLPTGLSTEANEERTQYLNKKLALVRLVKLIEMKNQKCKNKLEKTMWSQHNFLTRGNPVRVYEGMDFILKLEK